MILPWLSKETLTEHLDQQKVLTENFFALTDLLQLTVDILHNNGKISDDLANTFSKLVEISGDFEVVRMTDGLDDKCLKDDMLKILTN